MSIFDFVPSLNGPIYWTETEKAYPILVKSMALCRQDNKFHAEGDVYTHVKMACQKLIESEGWQALSESDRAISFVAAFLHDMAKPEVTHEDEDGCIRAPYHSTRGDILARPFLFRENVPFLTREKICSIIRWHTKPFFLVDDEFSQRLALHISVSTDVHLLSIQALADLAGRISHVDTSHTRDNIKLSAPYATEIREKFSEVSPFARFRFLRSRNVIEPYPVRETKDFEVVLMSVFPASGKDTWIERNLPDWPVISLDAIREEIGHRAGESQAQVIAIARTRAKEFMRKRESFVWNATNMTRKVRKSLVDLFLQYDAYVKIVYLEKDLQELLRRNEQRQRSVPDWVCGRMSEGWQIPDLSEAHEVIFG